MNVLVIGAGHMGCGIAAAAMLSGDRVKLIDTNPERAEAGVSRARERAARLRTDVPGTVEAASWTSELSDVGMVVEAVAEDTTIKATALRRAAALAPNAVLATNTSSLSVAHLATVGRAPARTLGLHFFSPAHTSQLVEAVGHAQLDPAQLVCAVSWATHLGKTVVVVKDTPGFIVNRVARPLYLEAERLVEAGAAAEDVDAELRAIGFPVGPLEIVDRTGLDIHAAVSDTLYQQLGYGRFRPVPVVRSLIDQGRLGLKSGLGFLAYEHGRRVDQGTLTREADDELSIVCKTILAAYVNEAAHMIDEGSATRTQIETALKLALGHPVGPFGWLPVLGGSGATARLLEATSRERDTIGPPAHALTTGELDDVHC